MRSIINTTIVSVVSDVIFFFFSLCHAKVILFNLISLTLVCK